MVIAEHKLSDMERRNMVTNESKIVSLANNGAK